MKMAGGWGGGVSGNVSLRKDGLSSGSCNSLDGSSKTPASHFQPILDGTYLRRTTAVSIDPAEPSCPA